MGVLPVVLSVVLAVVLTLSSWRSRYEVSDGSGFVLVESVFLWYNFIEVYVIVHNDNWSCVDGVILTDERWTSTMRDQHQQDLSPACWSRKRLLGIRRRSLGMLVTFKTTVKNLSGEWHLSNIKYTSFDYVYCLYCWVIYLFAELGDVEFIIYLLPLFFKFQRDTTFRCALISE